jgi:hypothetical protein
MIAEAKNPGLFLNMLAEEDRRMEKLAEALDLAAQMVDPMDAYRHGDETWLPMGAGFTGGGSLSRSGNMNLGLLTSGFDDELQLAMARDEMRYLAGTNPYAINAHENRVSYIVGDGHTYDFAVKQTKADQRAKKAKKKAERAKELAEKERAAKEQFGLAGEGELPPGDKTALDKLPSADEPDTSADDDAVDAIQEAADTFLDENDWHNRQQEIVFRLDRDGEVFLRLFPGTDGILRVRFVEPGHVATPTEKAGDKNVRFGILFDEEDAETPLGYWIKGELVDAKFIQHRKANVDRTSPRGVPLMFGVRQYLRRAAKNVLNISAKIDVISAIALIRKHSGKRNGVGSTVASTAQYQTTDPRNNQTVYARRFTPGTILDAPDTVEYEAPHVDGVDQLAAGVALNLRCIASRLVMPEFMLTSDASNANYASTMVAEGPSVKSFERLQKRQSCWDTDLIWLAVEAAGCGEAKELKKKFEVRVGMPTIISRDDLKKAQENEILYLNGVMSTQEWSAQSTLDYEKNQSEIEEHEEMGRAYKPGQAAPPAFGGSPFGGGNQETDDEGNPLPSRKPSDAANRMAALKGNLEKAESVEAALSMLREFAESIGG